MLDISGFEALFSVNYQALCITSYRIVQDKNISEDIVQDIFYKLWEKKELPTTNTSLKAYLFQAVVDQSLEYVKRFQCAFGKENLYPEDGYADIKDKDNTMALKGVGKRVEEAVRSLPEVCRLVFILSRYHKLSYPEIAMKLELPLNTVEGQLTNAIRHLRKFLFHCT
ncbi:RNA polymerase sigma-70 factor [Desertivirga brevis]|uniref:RNA polymerase sigma-70 factor n=1 Tax=Desertivirga brevis TaxID=2810310 RepID=UPI001A961BE0|nr:RNA polymerase sigma-70 factor [Pedobacter sp. SYSU D00873]